MRKLRVVVSRSRDGVPALVLATLLPIGAAHCGGSAQIEGGGAAAGTGGGQAGSGGQPGGSGGGGTGGSGLDGGSGGTGPDLCEPYEDEQTFEVEVPPEGVVAEPGQLCAVPDDPVESNRAAFVTLNRYSQAPHLATGAVEVDADVLAELTGLPTIEVWQADYGELMDMAVSNLTPSPTGFTFDAEWPSPLNVPPDQWARMLVRTTLTVQCVNGPPKQVQAVTHVHLCAELEGPQWVSSGEQCTTCTQICEMAPGPVGPDAVEDELPLAQALRVTLRVLARVGRALVVLAEHDGGVGLDHQWSSSAGVVEPLGPDVVLWTAPERAGPHQLMVAVTGSDRAAVASLPLA